MQEEVVKMDVPKILEHYDKNGYHFTTVENDPNGVRTYELKNGLKVFLAQNFDSPRIQTYIPVRTGSNNDPSDTTGLSHYLEHMLFKGSSKIGTSDWEKEKVLLDEIEELYEKHKEETDEDKKKEIYRKIDEVSQQASTYALANEYDKIISSLGASGTNAHTWLDETVYKNNIPANELETWLKVEHERFSNLVLRLFHTELESVYEEFNRAQDNDGRLVNYALMEKLFPTHPNGQQTTLGKAEHLRNPSMKTIYKYFSDYYVPNNYALVLVGDLDFDKTIELIDTYFGVFEFKELPKKEMITETPQTSIIKKIVKSPTVPRVQIAWRTDSYGSREAMLADVLANVLSNSGEAGLFDLYINQAQTMLYSQAFSVGFKQYGYFSAVAVPKENQSLDEAIKILFDEFDKVKNGEFPDWLLPSIINDFEVQRIKAWESANGLATTLYDTYIKGRTWADELSEMEIYKSFTKQDVVDFARDFLKDNYVAILKEKGNNENLLRVENPGITPVVLNKEGKSAFFEEISNRVIEPIEPQFVQYDKAIVTDFVGGKKISFVQNPFNHLAQVHLVFPFGSDHDKELVLTTFVLQYLGTHTYTSNQLKEEFFKIGISHDFKTANDHLVISLSGLEENIEKGISLLHHWISEVQADQQAYEMYVETMMENRAAVKKDKSRIFSALVNFAKYGAFSRYTNVVSKDRLDEISCEELATKVKSWFKYDYEVFYYGTNFDAFKTIFKKYCSQATLQIPSPIEYLEPETAGTVYFADYDMVQVEMSRVAKGENTDPYALGTINVFNEYFGRGLSSIVFQEMRESKSLAYSAYVSYQSNTLKNHPDYIQTYIGTQPDKLMIAVDTLQELMSEFPKVPLQFENAKESALKKIASTRITRTNLYFNLKSLNKLGINHDIRKDVYKEITALDFDKMEDFFKTKLQNMSFNTAIIGKKENLDLEAVSKLGELKEVSLEEIFGF